MNAGMAAVTMIYYMDVMSSWCTMAEPAIAEVRKRFAADLDYEWRIAMVNEGKYQGYTQDQMAWFYQRSGSITGVKLNPAWLGTPDGSYWANVAAEAARSLGCRDDTVRLAISRAALVEGRNAQLRDIALDVAVQASGLERGRLQAAMEDPAVTDRLRATTAEFRSMPCTMVPTFLLTNTIGDVNLLSGAYRAGHLASCIEYLLADVRSYGSFMAANPPPPGVE